jgi:hypothetical protein
MSLENPYIWKEMRTSLVTIRDVLIALDKIILIHDLYFEVHLSGLLLSTLMQSLD